MRAYDPLVQGWPITPAVRNETIRSKYPRQRALMLRFHFGRDYWTYFAVSPCERYAKIGRSTNPVIRVHVGYDIKEVAQRLGAGEFHIIRIYGGGNGLEERCHDFAAPERIDGEYYRIGPRVRILIARLDREFGPVDLRDDFQAIHARA